MEKTEVKISCACGNITGDLDLQSSLLPVPLEFCHCSTCRHVTGQLCFQAFLIPHSTRSSLSITGEPVALKTSDRLTRYSCGQCGATIYIHDSGTGEDFVASGVIDKSEGILSFKEHIFVGDTKDGGLSSWIDGPSWTEWSEKSEIWKPTENTIVEERSTGPQDGGEVLKCYCQCRGVQFNITRPNKDSSNVSSPVPDVLIPHHLQSSQTDANSAWWLRANGTKYLAGICACNSCRLSTGADLQAWAFVPKSNIRQLDGKELEYSMGTLKRYQHSKRAYREFCGTCGATVFWHCDERPGVVDVSVGLLDAEEGARAENWLEWATDRVSFEECAQNKTLVSSISRGLRKWGAEQSGSG
ncbi:MAG: hypothetical protein Q9184_001423 [Pyrenodesmia sp. 2 TL-2023]